MIPVNTFIDKRFFNVLYLSFTFLLIFSAGLTIGNLQKTINSSISEENPHYSIDGYVFLSIQYIVFSVSLWLAPSYISVFGYKIALITGGILYTIHLYILILELTWMAYLSAILAGIGGALLWSSQGQYIGLNSNEITMSRNIGVFWSIFSASFIIGNIYIATQFQGLVHIDRPLRRHIILVMGTMTGVATVLLAFVQAPPKEGGTRQEKEKPVEAFKKTWKLFCTKEMSTLLVAFIYTGFQQSFGNGVYPPSLGFSKQFGNSAKLLIPIINIFHGIGGSLGGIIPMVLAKFRIYIQRRYIIIFALTIETVAYAGIYVNLPNSAAFGETDEPAIIKPMVWLALVCGFLLGMGDVCINTQIFSILRDLHPAHSAHTCSLYKFSKNMSVALWLFASSYLGLHLQLSIMFLTGIVGAAAFSYIDLRQIRKETALQTSNDTKNENI